MPWSKQVACPFRVHDTVVTIDGDGGQFCLRLLGLQSLAARDLRRIGAAYETMSDLEQIGDHATDVAARVHFVQAGQMEPLTPNIARESGKPVS